MIPAASVRTTVSVPLRLPGGTSRTSHLSTFTGLVDGGEHLAIRLGDPRPAVAPLVRVHSECLTGDVLGSQRCDCGPQLEEALTRLASDGGYLLYLRQEGRGIGLYAKLETYALQDAGLDTYAANRALGYPEDGRDYTVAAQMLLALGLPEVRLLSNNPDKATQLRRLGIAVAEQVRTATHLTPANRRYLAAKRTQRAHTIDLDPDPSAA